jgi:hypothetical protein
MKSVITTVVGAADSASRFPTAFYYMKTDSYGQFHMSATCRQRLVRQSNFQILEAINPLFLQGNLVEFQEQRRLENFLFKEKKIGGLI